MAEKKTAAETKSDAADSDLKTAAQKSKANAADKKAEAEAKADKKAEDDAAAQGKVEDVKDVLQPTGGAHGTLEESKEEEAEEKGKTVEEDEGEEEPEKVENPLERDHNAEAAPFAGTAVAGSTEKTYNQVGQLYTDGLSGPADHNLDRAYGSGG